MMMQHKVMGGKSKILDMPMNGSSVDLMGHATIDTAMTYDANNAIFNGSTSKIRITNGADLNFSNGVNDLHFTIDIDFNLSVLQDFRLYTNGGLIIYYSAGVLHCDFYKDNTYSKYSYAYYTMSFATSTQYRLTISYDGRGGGMAAQGVKMTLNGSLLSTTVLPSSSNGYDKLMVDTYSWIGGTYNLFLNGKINYMKVFNKVYSPAEIDAL